MSLTCPTCRTTYAEGTVNCPLDTTPLLPDEAFANADVSVEPGTMIGEYRVEKKLGEGSFGAVYAGVQPLIGKKVAIKLLHKRMSSEPEIVTRFIDEARAVNRIGHRNIIDVFSFGVHEGSQHYFVMEFCEGMTLGQLLQQKKRLLPAEAMPILRGIADGLDAAHQAGVTHRDLKPDNVFLMREKDGSFFPKLLDFGVAKLVREEGAQQTATGVAIGTPRYMSPEQCRGKKVDHRTDIYALGCVTHEMLTGKPVFEADSTVDLLFKHTTEKPPLMSSVCPSLPQELDEPVLAMLAKRPLGRPNSAGAAVDALAEALRLAARAPKAAAAPELEVANTMRAPAVDDERAIPDDVPSTKDAIPATRKSYTELPAAEAKTIQVAADVVTEIAAAPPVQSQMPATLASPPLTAAVVVDKTPDVKVVGASTMTTATSTLMSQGVPSSQRSKQTAYIAIAGAVVLIGAGAMYMRRTSDSAVAAAPESAPSQSTQVIAPEPGTITLRLAVMPADARILVDGRDLGGAGDAIILPREKKQHAVRIERQGYESQTMWISAEVDKELGPISLTALAPAPSISASNDKPVVPAGKPATTKPRLNKDLWKPEELGGPK